MTTTNRSFEILKNAIDNDKITDEMVKAKSFPQPITHNDWKSKADKFFDDYNEYYMIETPYEDMRKIEQLLGVRNGFFPTPYIIKTKQEFCLKCHRRNNFLDVVSTGLKIHSAKFLIDVFTGKYGHIINQTPHQRCICFNCGSLLPLSATKFSSPKQPTI